MSQHGAIIVERLEGKILTSSVAPTTHDLQKNITYTAELTLPEGGKFDSVPVWRPLKEAHPATLHVWPLKAGDPVIAYRRSTGPGTPAEYSWEYKEEPLYRKCDGTIIPRST